MAETGREPDPLATPDGVLETRAADFSSGFAFLFFSTCLDWDDSSDVDESLVGT